MFPSAFNYLTSGFFQIQRDFLDGKISVKWGNLFPQYQQVFDQEKLPIYLGLQKDKAECYILTAACQKKGIC